jgi:hypothetical protein
MAFRSLLSKIIIAILGITIGFLLLDFFFFNSQNTQAIITAIIIAYSVNPILSWSVVFVLVIIIVIGSAALICRRRSFISALKDELAAAERIPLIELAQRLDETPARIEVELNRMASSKVRKFSGLLILSQGKHVFLGEKLLDEIVNLYNQGISRGEIASELQISRDELDKAILHLIDKGVIQHREEKVTRKVRPSYRRGTR